MRLCILYHCIIILLGCYVSHSKIQLEQNGYTSLLVSIDDEVSENIQLLNLIKSWLTDASKKLYVASEYRVYFKEITIRIPNSWSNDGKYNVTSTSIRREGDIRIEDPKQNVRSNPFACCLPGCGVGGQYIHFTTDVLFDGNNGKFGNLATVLVHEWGHMRWGLFDEYPTIKDTTSGNKIRFYLERGSWEPVRCTKQIAGKTFNIKSRNRCALDASGKPEPDCYFSPHTDSSDTGVASLMGSAYIPTLSQFCDNDPNNLATLHNSFAPNNHNSKCDGKSSWEIIRQHDDYKRTSTGSAFVNTIPKFFLQQEEITGRFCLSIDVSGSMKDTIQQVKSALTNLIKNGLPNNSYVAIVSFSKDATVLKSMTKIESEDTRNNLLSYLPSTVDGGTSIGAGLQKCYEVLSTSGNVKESVVYLATDGRENRAPYIAHVLPTLTQAKIIVDTLAIGQSADPYLKTMSDITGGSSFFFTTSDDSTALVDALIEPFTQSSKDPLVRVKSEHVYTSQSQHFSTKFYLDDTIGRETAVQLTSEMLNGVKLTVQHLTNVYTNTGSEQDQGVMSVKIPSIAEKGLYTVTILSPLSELSGILTVTSKSARPGNDVLQTKVLEVQSEIDFRPDLLFPLYAFVFRGSAPVTKASVTALIENGYGHTTLITLKDNAIGADVTANDGIYSGYVLPTHIRANGRHSLKVVAEGRNSSIMIPLPVPGSVGKDFIEESFREESIGSFMRVTLANEIEVTNYIQLDSVIDFIPPSPILTLHLTNANNEEKKFTLSWLAVGDDLDTGKVSWYDVRYSTDYNNLKSSPNTEANLKTENIPKEPGEEEIFTFQIPNIQNNVTYFIIVRAVDDAGNFGNVSNVVTVSILTDPDWLDGDETEGYGIGLVIGLFVGSAIVLSVFVACIVFIARRRSVPLRSNNPI